MDKTPALLILTVMMAGCVEPLPTDDGAAVAPSGDVTDRPMAKSDIPANAVQLAASILAPAIADLAARTGTAENRIIVRRAMPVVWNDGSVGCPEPGMAYTQAVVPGYWALLEHDGRYYSYHAASGSGFRLCERAMLGPDDAPPHGRYNDDV